MVQAGCVFVCSRVHLQRPLVASRGVLAETGWVSEEGFSGRKKGGDLGGAETKG